MRHYLGIAIAIVWAAASGPSPVGAQDGPAGGAAAPEITRMRDDLYLLRDGGQYSVFLVTPEGVILADPLSRAAALWLRDELGARFHQGVRFVLHTHHHFARSAGSSVFNDTADIVAQQRFNAALAGALHELPERYRFALRTTHTFSRERIITLGGQTVAMIHVPSSRSPEMTAIHFPRQRVVFAGELPGIGRVPFSFATFEPRDVYTWIEALAPLAFDSLVLGDGRVVPRAEIDELATYLLALRDALAAGVREGRTLSEIQSRATLERFRANPHYAKRESQLSDVYPTVRSSAAWFSAGAAASYSALPSEFCVSRTSCTGGGTVPAARFTLSAAAREGLDVVGEVTLGGQAWSARTSPSVDEEAATRRSRAAFLLRYNPSPARFRFALAGGGAVTVDDVRGLDRVKGALRPTGGSHPIERRYSSFGLVIGADLEHRLGRGVSIRLPVRVTRMFHGAEAAYFDSTLDVQAGIDVTFTLFHRVSFR